MKPNISIIISTHKICKRLENCIDSINKHTTLQYEIIVLYTGSIKKDIDKLPKFPNTRYLPCYYTNISSAYNIGIKNSKGNDIILLSPQVIVKPDWDINIIECSQIAPSVGLVGKPKKSINTPTIKNLQYYITEKLSEDCLLIKRAVIDAIGGFDESFCSTSFMFDDFFLRARFDGFEIFSDSKCYTSETYKASATDNIDYLDSYSRDKGKFIKKWKDFLPIKNDLISEILNRIPVIGDGGVLLLGDNLIISNTLSKRGYNVNSISHSDGYSSLKDKGKRYRIIIFFDNITQEQTLIRLLEDCNVILKSDGLIMANIQNSLFIERIHYLFTDYLPTDSFDSNLKYPLSYLSKSEILSSGNIPALELIYLIGFASKPTHKLKLFFEKLLSIYPNNNSLKEELSIEEYLSVWQKSQFRN